MQQEMQAMTAVLQEGVLVISIEGRSHLKMRLLQQGGFRVGFKVGPLVSWGSISVEL